MNDPFPSVSMNFANALSDPWSGGVRLFLANKTPTSIQIVTAFIAESHHMPDEGTLLPEAGTIKLTKESAKGLMDALWNCGVRPSAQDTSEGHVKALTSHLADMRQISFMTLGLEKP